MCSQWRSSNTDLDTLQKQCLSNQLNSALFPYILKVQTIKTCYNRVAMRWQSQISNEGVFNTSYLGLIYTKIMKHLYLWFSSFIFSRHEWIQMPSSLISSLKCFYWLTNRYRNLKSLHLFPSSIIKVLISYPHLRLW